MSARRRSVAASVGNLLPRIAAGKLPRLPFPIRFWDGSVLPTTGAMLTAERSSNGRSANDPNGRSANGRPGAPHAAAVITVSRRAVAHLLHAPGQLGLARAWVDGSLGIEGDLEAVLAARHEFDGVSLSRRDLALVAIEAVRAAGPGILRRPPVPSIESRVRGSRHSQPRDGEAVRHHYDLSNEFYRLVLGPSMVYSCAYFEHPNDPLERAQQRKLDLICRKLMLAPGERLLDVGCGWGSLALHAARQYGAEVLGITLSEPQAQFAGERAAELGLERQVRFEVADYRELSGQRFDKIASVGMFEHVGQAQLTDYFDRLRRLLTPGGLLLNHGIGRLAPHRPQTDEFIARYIFPDGELLPLSEVVAAVEHARLEPRDVESLREHYPLTLRAWTANLRANRAEAVAVVGAERVRTWELYMLASALGFEDAEITVYQVLAARGDGPHGLPLDRLSLLAPRSASAPAVAGDRSAADQVPISGNDRPARGGTM
jgi:cyclopropane-fatty-acyl-phospholipid synthase